MPLELVLCLAVPITNTHRSAVFWMVVAAAAIGVAYVLVRMVRSAFRFGGTRLARCPETSEYVGVHVDPKSAAVTGLSQRSHLRLDSCTRWPERRDCGQECLRQIENSPEDCLLRTIAARWYHHKRCVYCGRDLSEFQWHDFRCALRTPGGKTVDWREVPPQDLPAALEHAQPVCWNCHIAEAFRRQHPELVTDRPGDVVGPMGERSGQ